ncbi:MAG TPA: hypothetical protein DDZ89_15680, partial [Clostridiales bacterium]|nr:hypothetical protein [Clostridiales bacterium]
QYGENIFHNPVSSGNLNNEPIHNNQPEKSSMDNEENGGIDDPTAKRTSINRKELSIKIFPVVWLVGAAGILLYLLWINALQRIQSKRYGVCERKDILEALNECKFMLHVNRKVAVIYSPNYKSPGLYGLFHPKIIINKKLVDDLSHNQIKYVFLHEITHLKRKDLLINAMSLFTLAIHWFNPLIWYTVIKMKQDCEIACDAAVLDIINPEDNKNYGLTIINMLQALSGSGITPGTISFANKYNKRRILMITRHKKASFIWTITAILICLLILVGCSGITQPTGSLESGDGKDIVSNDSTVKPKDNAEAPAETTKPGETILEETSETENSETSNEVENRYDIAGFDSASEFEGTFHYLQEQVQLDHREIVAEYIAYPIQVNMDGSRVNIENEDEFVNNYNKIFTEAVKKAFLEQDVKETFVNYKGVMVGNGELWFNMLEGTKHKYSIYGINN